MAKHCVLIPQVVNSKSQKVNSRLFQDLLAFTGNNREETKRLYEITKSEEFIKNWNPRLVMDDSKEPTIRSLLDKTNLSQIITESKILEKLNRDIGYYKKGMDRPALWVDNEANYQKLLQRAISFNQNSEFRDKYVARLIKIMDNESNRVFLGVKVEKRNSFNSIETQKMEYNSTLNNKLREILESKGVSIGALTDLEKRMGINGVADFDVARASAEGLVEMIRLADGIRGEKALPEEFAHFAIEAMGNSPLVTRLLNYLDSNGLVTQVLGESYDSYDTLYNSDRFKLAKEAAGKLLAKHLLMNESLERKPYRSLLERIINAIKTFFKGFNTDQITRAMYDADKQFGELAKNILTGKIDKEIQLGNIKNSELFYQTNERVQRDKKLLQKIIENEGKRLKIYGKRNPESKFNEKQETFIQELKDKLETSNELEGIYSFLENALEELGKLRIRLEMVRLDDDSTINQKSSVLRDIRNYLYSYSNILKEVRKALLEEEKYDDNRYGQRARVAVDNMTNLLADLASDYNGVAVPLFVQFIKPILGEAVEIPFGKFQGKKITAEELITEAAEDISLFDMWLDSMANSSDRMLRLIDKAVKKSKNNSRLKTLDIMKKLQAAAKKLEQSGINDFEWMFEKDSQGNKSGNYITALNMAIYYERKNAFLNNLENKYGQNPIGEDAENYKIEKRRWILDNTELVEGKRQPKMSKYGNKVFQNLTASQKEFYETVIGIKEQLDSYLPPKTTKTLNAIKIRKDLVERVKSSNGVKEGISEIWESIKDDFVRRTDDTDFGTKSIMMDFENHQVNTLPIYFTNLKEGESFNDLSTDIVSTLTAYASMALDYHEMSKIINVLELGRDLIRDRGAKQIKGGRIMKETYNVLGVEVENELVKNDDSTSIMKKLNHFFDSQVYGKYIEDEGTLFNSKIDKGKAANFINRITSINNQAINVLSASANVAVGTIMMRIESFSEEFFKPKNVRTADKIYGASLPEFLAQIGSRIKTNKLALWNELFDVGQEYDKEIKNIDYDRKSWFSKMFNTSTLFMLSNAGEHWMQTRTSLALSDVYKMKAPNGKIVSLWDAMEVVPIDKNNKQLGAKLQIKAGYTKEDGSPFTQDDIFKFSRKVAAINHRMHGIYNKADQNVIQRLALGRMAILYRKWIKPAFNWRFDPLAYDEDLGSWTEGYYRTTGRFLINLVKELRESQFSLAANWNNLKPEEKANIKRAVTEVSHFATIAIIMGLVDWPDDKDRPWLSRMAEYLTRRTYSEIGVMIPGPSMFSEGLRIAQSPAAGINTIENATNLIGIINPFNWEFIAGEEAVIQSGRYKGESKAMRIFYESPLLPMNKTIYKVIHPEEGIPFYKQ